MTLTDVSLRYVFADHSEVIVPLDADPAGLCCRPTDGRHWLDVGPGCRIWFQTDGRIRAVVGVGVFRSLPTIVGDSAGGSPVFERTGREVVHGVESGELVEGVRWRARRDAG